MGDLFMVRIALKPSRVFASARRHRLPPNLDDIGYVVHGLLADLFGSLAPKPFSISETCRGLHEVLAYAPVDHVALEEEARRFASPESFSACDWSGNASKPMPSRWTVGSRLGFQLRACPVRRLGKQGALNGEHRMGAEVDAFLAACFTHDQGVDRRAVYSAWLEERLRREGAVELTRIGILSFRRARLVRKSQGDRRTPKVLERPDVLFEGELVVRDEGAFGALLSDGIGRHRAFGFGMLLLSRPTTSC